MSRISSAWVCLPFTLWACGSQIEVEPPPAKPDTCLGQKDYCGLRYDQLRYATTHNGMSSYEDAWLFANHDANLSQQLQDGIRGLMWDLYVFEEQVYLCHSLCEAGRRLFSEALLELKNYLDDHPDVVITLILENYVDAPLIEAEFGKAGLSEYLVPAPKGPWPRLGTLIEENHRLVVFTNRGGGAFKGYLDVWKYSVDTDFSIKNKEEFDCRYNRGKAENSLFILNHFITNPLPSRDASKEINQRDFLLSRIRECEREHQRPANFISVDFYQQGDLILVTNKLNQEKN